MINRSYAIFLGLLVVVFIGVGVGAFLLTRTGRLPDEPEIVAPDQAPEDMPVSARPETIGPRLYLVLDDAGQTLGEFSRFLAFGEAATIAVLPHLPAGTAVIDAARAVGHDVILHQPMEAVNGEDPGPGALYTHHSGIEIREILEGNLRRYPEVVGVNNHMGSRITSDERIMETVLQVLREENLFFLDSRTTHTSVVPEVAERLDIPVLVRHVFLDHIRNRDEINSQLDHALGVAREQGFVIMVGHITVPETIDVLLERQREIVTAGYRFFPLAYAYKTGDIHRHEKGERDADAGY